MFKTYLEFIFKNAENPRITKEIIRINQKMLYKLNKKKHNYKGGNKKEDIIPEYKQEILKFKEDTIQIINSIEEPLRTQYDLLKKSQFALIQLIKYIDILYKTVKQEELETIRNQLTELKEKLDSLLE
jgi:hypothetical protein